MEAGLDNANATNNLFSNSNGTEILQQKDGFLLNLTEGFKQNGAELSPSNEYVFERPSNGKRPAEEFDEDEDMGPETDVDAIDDALSPSTEQANIDNKNIEEFDPFTTEIEEKVTLEMDLDIQKQQTSEFEPPRTPREETPTPPADEVHDAGVEENVADSGEDSEDEWNYYKGDSAESDKVSSSKADQEVAELTKTVEEDEEAAMSQLNPNAAEFVPISSPTRNVVSPVCRALINDEVIAQSPRRATPTDIDINLPNPQDFEKEVKNRPSDVYSNGQDADNAQKLSTQEVMENLLNGKNIEDIEFHPGTPQKSVNPEEFHFGPNATPFSTPSKFLDQSEAALSTKAEFGDESSYLEGKTLDSSFVTTDNSNTNPFTTGEDVGDFQRQLNKSADPMSTSFYQDEGETNPFDLNKVQMLPDDDELLEKPDKNGQLNETISDLPEHDPLAIGEPIVTQLDGSAESADSNLLCGISQLPETPEPVLPPETCTDATICDLPPATSPILIEASKAPLPITPEPNSEEQEDSSALKTPDATSPLPQGNVLLDIDDKHSSMSPIPPTLHSLRTEEDFSVSDVKAPIESNVIVESNVKEEDERFTPVLSPEPIDELNELINSAELANEELCQQALNTISGPDHKLSVVLTPESTEELVCQTKPLEPVEFSKSFVPTADPELICSTIDINKKVDEFFPICQELTKHEDNAEVIREEEFFPICSKPNSKLPVIEDQIAVSPELFPRGLQEFELPKSPILTVDETELQSKSPVLLTDNTSNISSKSPILEDNLEIKSQSPTFEGNLEGESKSPIPEYFTKSPIPTIDDTEISTSPEPTTDTFADSFPKSTDVTTSQATMLEATIDIPAESEKKSPEPIAEPVLEYLAKPYVPILDNLQELRSEFQQDISVPSRSLESETPVICARELIEECSFTHTQEPVTETLTTNSELSVSFQQLVLPDFVKGDGPEMDPPILLDNVAIIPKPTEMKESLEASEQLLVDEIQTIFDAAESAALIDSEAKSPETIEESLDSEKRDIESPMEDITSSVKDDNSLTPEIIEEAKDINTEKETIKDSVQIPETHLETIHTNYQEQLYNAIQETETIIEKETTSEISSTPNTTFSEQADTESVNTAEINSILEKCIIPDVTSPLLSPGEESLQQILEPYLSDSHIILTEDVIKTDLITPQYPEETVITPSDETKVETTTPVTEEKEAPAALPEVALEAETKEKVDETIVAAVVGSAAAAATVAAVTSTVKDKKASKPATKLPPPAAKRPSKLNQSPTKTVTLKSTSPKPPISAKSTVSSPTKLVPSKIAKTTTLKAAPAPKMTLKPPSKPKNDTATTKTIEKKSLTNGDLKTQAKSPITAKRTSTTPTRISVTAKNPIATRPSPVKSDIKSGVTKVSSTKVSLSSTTVKLTSTVAAPKTTTAAPKLRPTSLSAKTTGSSSTTKTASTVPANKTTVQSKVGITASSPKSTTAKPKPPTSLPAKSPTVPKPKLTSTRSSTTKTPDTEKQIKDSVNKQLTATNRATFTRTTGTTSMGKTTTTVKKTETKSPSTRTTTTTKTTLTSIKSTNKKPTEITRITAKKTIPTKTTTIKTQQNGLTNGVTTTIVQETTTILSTEPQLIKDLSPVENKLLVDNSQLSETNVAD